MRERWSGIVLAVVVTSCGASVPEAEAPQSPEPSQQEATPAEQSPSDAAQPPPSAPAAEPAPATRAADGAAADEEAAESAAGGEGRAAELHIEAGVDDLLLELGGFSEQLTEALQASTPDCDSAERFRDAVCDLSRRICEIAGTGSLSSKCHDGKRRCEESHQDYARHCPQ